MRIIKLTSYYNCQAGCPHTENDPQHKTVITSFLPFQSTDGILTFCWAHSCTKQTIFPSLPCSSVMSCDWVLGYRMEAEGLDGTHSPIQRKSVLNIHWKDWCQSWNSSTLVTWWEELTHWKRPWCWERLRAGREGDSREWDGWMASPIDGNGFQQAPRVEGQFPVLHWHAVVYGVAKSWTQLSDWSELI